MRITEKEIENQILHYLHFASGAYAWKVNNTGVFDPKKKVFRRKSKYDVNGQADITCVLHTKRGSVTVFLEVKTPTGTQSKSQKEFESNITSVGGHYFIVRSVEDVIECLKKVK